MVGASARSADTIDRGRDADGSRERAANPSITGRPEQTRDRHLDRPPGKTGAIV